MSDLAEDYMRYYVVVTPLLHCNNVLVATYHVPELR